MQELKEVYIEHEMSLEQRERLLLIIGQAKRENAKERKIVLMQRFTAIAAVLVAGFIFLTNVSNTVAYAMEQIPIIGQMPFIGQLVKVVTAGEYEYEDERHRADLEIPQLVLDETVADEEGREELWVVTEEINQEILNITEEIIAEFETYLVQENGYYDVVVTSELLATTEKNFALKLICYQAAADGAEWNYYYTIDLNTGERLQLKDIFEEGTDYITPISESIKEQMQTQMKRNFSVTYWIDDELKELNFEVITEDASFYLNEYNQLVIAFNEGEVAPMSMGAVEFVIPDEVIEKIRK